MANFNLQKWNDIGTSRTVQNWIRNGVSVIFDTGPEPFYHDNHALSKEQSLFVDKEIAALLLLGAIEQLDYQPHCVSALGVVPKKHNKFRLIHNLQELNSHCVSSGFQYQDIRSVRKCVRPGDQLVTLDIKEGFFTMFPSPVNSGTILASHGMASSIGGACYLSVGVRVLIFSVKR